VLNLEVGVAGELTVLFAGEITFFDARRYASAVVQYLLWFSVCVTVCHKSVFYRNGLDL